MVLIPPVSNGRWYFICCDIATERRWRYDPGSTDYGNYMPNNYHIVLEWKEEMSEARRISWRVIFTPKHEHGFKLLRGQRH